MEDTTPPRMEDKLQVGWLFFKVMTSGFHTKLNLPPLVCEKLKGDEPLQATLVTEKGKWEVGIRHGSQGKLYLEKGWDVFVKNHGLKVGEFAVFEYIGGGICFDVSLLDKNGSDKKDSELEKDDEQITASKLNQSNEVDDIEEGEIVDYLAAVKLEHDEEIITSHINARLAPLYALLAEIDDTVLPSHVNIRQEDNEGRSQENITKHDNNKCGTEQERNEEIIKSSQPNSSLAEIGHKKGGCSVKRKRDDERVPSQAKIQKHEENKNGVKQKLDKNKNCVKQKNHEDQVPSKPKGCAKDKVDAKSKLKLPLTVPLSSQAKIQKHEENKNGAKQNLDKNKNCVKQKNHEDQVPSQPKGCAKDKVDAKIKSEPKVNDSSPEQFSTIMKAYHLRSRSPYMHIPAEFCVANELYQNARITLKGPSDKREVSLKVCKGGKTKYAIITRGWPEFIAGNDLKEGETCIFKLHSKRNNSSGVVLDVKVLRASS